MKSGVSQVSSCMISRALGQESCSHHDRSQMAGRKLLMKQDISIILAVTFVP